jgi:AbrB family looped-hinge helix DNA binding protein
MNELLAVVTRKGQVTIPAEVRKALDLKRGDVVAFTLPDNPAGRATFRRAATKRPSVVERTYGVLHSSIPALSPEEEARAFEEGVAEDVEEGKHHQQIRAMTGMVLNPIPRVS